MIINLIIILNYLVYLNEENDIPVIKRKTMRIIRSNLLILHPKNHTINTHLQKRLINYLRKIEQWMAEVQKLKTCHYLNDE